MNEKMEIIYGMVNFVAVAIIFLVVLAVFFKITLKKYSTDNNKIKFYGLFLGMDNRSILAFSCASLSYIFLVWLTATFTDINVYYFFIVLTLVMTADIVTKNYKKIPNDLFFVGISALCIVVTNIIYDYLRTEYATIFLIIILGLLIIFVFMFYTYNLFKKLNDIVTTNKYINKEKYKKL